MMPRSRVGCRMSIGTVGAATLVIALAGSTAAAPRERADSGPYCGLYCAYGALQAIGKNVAFEALLQPRYLSQRQGSSISELRQAVIAAGAYAVAFSGLGAESLRSARDPMILHVASDGQLRRYNHWVLFCGINGGKCRILDAPNPVEELPLSDIMCRWNGTALVVSRAPIDEHAVIAREYTFQLGAIALALSILYVADSCCRHPALSRLIEPRRAVWRSPLQGLMLLVCSVVLGVTLHSADDTGFLRSPAAANYVAAANIPRFFPKLNYDQARRFMDARSGTIIDARFADTYAMGHIRGALNIPIDTSPAQRRLLLAGVPRRAPVLVYCQSSRCEFDEVVASLLARRIRVNFCLPRWLGGVGGA